MRLVKKLLNHTETYVILIALLFGVAVEAVSHQFFSNTGMVNLARISMIYLIFGVAEMLSLVCAGPDVSYPAIASLSAFLAASLFGGEDYQGSILTVFLFAMLIGAVCGAVNGAIIARFNFPSLIVTLGTSSIFSGLMYGPLRASNTVLHGKMAEFGAGSLFTVTNPGSGLTAQMPTQFLIVIVVYVIMHFVLRYTMFGRGLYAIGSDSVAAERAGLKVGRIRFFAYVLGGALAAHGHSMAAGAGRCAVLRKPCAQCGPCGPLHRVAHRESPWQQGRLCAPVRDAPCAGTSELCGPAPLACHMGAGQLPGVRYSRQLPAGDPVAGLAGGRPLSTGAAARLFPAAKSPGGHRRPQHPGVFSACRHPLRAVPAADSGIPLHPACAYGAAAGGHCCVCRPAGGCVQRLAQRGHLAAKRPPDPALAARLPSARHLRALPCSGPDGHAVAMGRGGAPHEPHPHLSGRGEGQGAQRKVQRTAFFAFLKL